MAQTQEGSVVPIPPSLLASTPPPTAQSPVSRAMMPGGAASFAPPQVQLASPQIDQSLPQAAPQAPNDLRNVISSVGLGPLVENMISMEGGSARGVVNNPGNIKYTGLPGETDSGVHATDGGTYASFATPEAGKQAVASLMLRASRGEVPEYGANPTWQSFVNTYQGKGALSSVGSGLQQAGEQAGRETQEELRGVLGEVNEEQQRYAKIAASAPAGSEEANRALAEQMRLSEQSAATFDKLASQPPHFTPMSVMQRMGGLATVIAVLGGLKSRQPLTASLNAAGQAMKALNQGNYDEYRIAFDQWKTQSNLVVQSLHAHAQAVNQILENKRLSQEEKNSELNAIATEWGNDFLKAKLAANAVEAPYRFVLEATNAANAQKKLEISLDRMNDEIAKNQQQSKHIELQNEVLKQQLGSIAGGQGLDIPSAWAGMPSAPPPGVDPSSWSFALNYAKTGRNPPVGWGNSIQRLEFQKLYPVAQHALGIDPTEQQQTWIDYEAQKRRATAIETSFGSGMNGRNLISLNTVADHLDLLREYADALRNKDLVAENHIINRMATQAGMPEVIQFALARTIAGDEVIRLLTTTGGTVEDRSAIQKILSEYASPAQLTAAIDTATNFVRGRYGPLRQFYAHGDPAREKYFNDNMMTPAAEEMFAAPERPVVGGSSEQYKSPDDVYRDFDAGKLTKDQAKKLLIQRFGFTQ